MNESLLRTLSPRERQVLVLIAACYSDKGIARKMNREPSTVQNHVQHIKEKLQIRRPEEFNMRAILLRAGDALIEMDQRDGQRVIPDVAPAKKEMPSNVIPFTA